MPSSGLTAGVVGGVFLSLVVLVSKLVVDYIYHICVGGGQAYRVGGRGISQEYITTLGNSIDIWTLKIHSVK